MKTDERDKISLEYVPGAADDGMGFFPVVTCQIGSHPPKVLWVVHHRRRQLRSKEEALSAANDEIALAFQDRTLPSSPERFREHLWQRGFSDLASYRVAGSFDQDRLSALGDEYQPVFGEEAARHDPVVHAALMQRVDRQIAENDPPEVREAFERLFAQGYGPEYIRRMIGFLIARENLEEMFQGTPFNRARFIENLRRLPQIVDL
ncbi:MAG TPA: hypothetical protein VH394_18385 [Thermoanaerobaculia bacterium]|jgi:hypothetical protein|nr:hypothetical protein [Thermoanaerobaculia bacterium]